MKNFSRHVDETVKRLVAFADDTTGEIDGKMVASFATVELLEAVIRYVQPTDINSDLADKMAELLDARPPEIPWQRVE